MLVGGPIGNRMHNAEESWKWQKHYFQSMGDKKIINQAIVRCFSVCLHHYLIVSLSHADDRLL